MPGGAGAQIVQALACPVQWWPARFAAHEDLVVIGVDGGAPRDAPAAQRDAARASIRLALRAALGQLAGLPPQDITIQSWPGRAPAVSYPGQGGPAPGISITHDEPLSLAAIHLHGTVGIDLQRIREIDDWRAVALDYLGPDTARLLDAVPAPQRAGAFARAWSAHEARLKCHSLALAEWTPQLAAQLAGCQCRELALPPGFAGAVAWRRSLPL